MTTKSESSVSDIFVCVPCRLRLQPDASEDAIFDWWSKAEPDDSESTPCVVCLGLFRRSLLVGIADKVAERFRNESFDAIDFSFFVSYPVSLAVREFLAKRQFCCRDDGDCWEPLGLRAVWRRVAMFEVQARIGLPRAPSSEFAIQVSFAHEDEDADCGFLQRLFPAMFRRRRKRVGAVLDVERAALDELPQDEANGDAEPSTGSKALAPRAETASSSVYKMDFNRTNVEQAVGALSASPDRLKELDVSIAALLGGVTRLLTFNVEFIREPLFVAGRYNKFSRYVTQTPWLLDDEAEDGEQAVNSIEGYICEPLKRWVAAESFKFMAAGREDVDVRCLGSGRPFAVQLQNPRKKLTLNTNDLVTAQTEINRQTKDIRVSALQIVDESSLKVLKDGEETKTKEYAALCCSSTPLTAAILVERLDTRMDVQIVQKTPLRVLHRRPLAERTKRIHQMQTRFVDDFHFVIKMCTQAGTYVKEFVHGDFGRTKPSVGDLLECEVDILELDVLAVNLEFPREQKV